MSMSDCSQCRSTPCECEQEYLSWTEQRLREQIAMLQRVLDSKLNKVEPKVREVKDWQPRQVSVILGPDGNPEFTTGGFGKFE